MKFKLSNILHDRLCLFSSILVSWLFFRIIEIILPDRILSSPLLPVHLDILFLILIIMAVYSVLIFFTQRKQNLISKRLPELKNYPEVSVLIPAHNEESVIIDTLNNITQLEYSNLNIYIIDDRSTDNTKQLVTQYLEEYTGSHKLFLSARTDSTRPGKSAGLNDVIHQTNSEYYLVCDGDARLSSDCLLKALPYFYTNEKIGALQFQKRNSNANENLLTRCQDYEMAFDTYLQGGRDSLNGFVELRGNGLIISKECINDVGGWDENSLTEDLEMSIRLHIYGWIIKFTPQISVYEQAVNNHIGLYKQRRRWAEGSLRRYLKYFYELLSFKPSKMTFKQKLDILPFLSQFAVPFWVSLDLCTQIFNIIIGKPTYLPLLTFITIAIGIILWVNVLIGIIYWRPEHPKLQCIKYATWGVLYIAYHWPIIVLLSIRKILFGRRPYKWVKTARSI